MKLGTENKKKTIWAAILGVVALLLVAFELVPFFAGSGAPAASAPITSQQTQVQQALQPTATTTAARPRGQKSTGTKSVINSLDPTIRLDLLDAAERHHYEGSGRNIFEAYTPPPPRPQKKEIANNTPAPPPVYVPPPPPPINLNSYGWTSKKGQPRRVFLSQGDEIFIAGEGQLVANRYKVVKITDSSVQIEDILNNNTQAVPIT